MTTVSAQVLTQACISCTYDAAKILSPTCTISTFTSRTPASAMTPKEKACLCPLASSSTWLSRCSVTTQACSPTEANSIYNAYSENKDIICSDISSPPRSPSEDDSPGTNNPNTPVPPNNNAGGSG
ncbi:hypothetical protein BGZ96_008151, partial [Linnemannia gamsii]